VKNLQSTLRWTVFKWVVRGLFEKHRLIFLTQLTFSLLTQGVLGTESGYTPEAMKFLLFGPKATEEKSPISWVTDVMWSGLRDLSLLDGFEKLPADVEENSPRFLEWYQHFTPESEKLPGDWRELDKYPFQKLLVVRILRPDRMTAALNNFICELLPNGKEYVECDSQFSSFQVLESSFEDSSPLIPLYFILSPGADIVSDINKLAMKTGKVKGVDYHNISLGQGQDVVAAERLEVGHRQGHWIVLNNVHLMPRWLSVLEKKLEEYSQPAAGTHEGFRVLLSSDPAKSIPVSILDRAIKITSDPPSGLKANLKQAFACFSAETYEELEPRTKGILFGLCHFHAVMVERKKFGAKGYNMMYPFSFGDLVCSAAVLRNYMEMAPAKVPWADLRYLFGEIMYGGHIVNGFDRLLANQYLDFYMKEDLLDEKVLYPYLDEGGDANKGGGAGGGGGGHGTIEEFRAPSTTLAYEKVLEHIEDTLKSETPVAFGLHPNAEVGFRTSISETLLKTILELSASTDDAASGDVQSSEQVAEAIIQDVVEILRDARFDVDAIISNVEEVGPFQNVILQECDRMNLLTGEIVRSLMELDLGFRGELTMSEGMEELAQSLFMDRIPKRWEILAYPSLRSLSSWLANLQNRIAQAHEWSGTPADTPVVTWISGLFNPQSFLTAVMQFTAQAQTLELDKLCLVTDITRKMLAEEMTTAAKEGTYIVGLALEGGSFNVQSSLLEASKPREMFSPLPVINIRPVIISDKIDTSLFSCPVYKTALRGANYVFSVQLKSKHESGKWVLAGVVAVMEVL
jgi:dynein heavy chain